jgi:hypothetical protein
MTTWMPVTSRVPEDEREDFIEDFAAGFLESFPPDAENNIHVGVVRFELEAVKPGP